MNSKSLGWLERQAYMQKRRHGELWDYSQFSIDYRIAGMSSKLLANYSDPGSFTDRQILG